MPNPLFNRFSIYPCRIGDILLRQIHDVRVSPQVMKADITPGGLVDRAHIATAHAEPHVRIVTSDFDGVFAGGDAVDIGTGYVSDTIGYLTAASIFQYQIRAPGAIFQGAGGAVHRVLTGTRGFTCVDRIHAEQDSQEGAQIELHHYALSQDGITEPLIPSTTTLTSTPQFNNIYHLGPVYIGTIGAAPLEWIGVESVSIQPGVVFQVKRASGNPFAGVGSIVARNPEVTIRFTDMLSNWADGLDNLFHNAITSSGSINVFLWQSLHGGARQPGGDADHIQIIGVLGEEHTENISVSKIDDATTEVKFSIIGAPLDLQVDQELPS